jgi:hypothetical protein
MITFHNPDMGWVLKIDWLTTPQRGYERALFTVGKEPKRNITVGEWQGMLNAEHSVLKSVILTVRAFGLPAYSTSVHLVRHGHVLNYVKGNREDWNGGKARSIDDTVDQIMDFNIQSLIDTARKRLCNRASLKTRRVIQDIAEALKFSGDPYMEALGYHLVANCEYRGDRCPEGKRSCGKYPLL